MATFGCNLLEPPSLTPLLLHEHKHRNFLFVVAAPIGVTISEERGNDVVNTGVVPVQVHRDASDRQAVVHELVDDGDPFLVANKGEGSLLLLLFAGIAVRFFAGVLVNFEEVIWLVLLRDPLALV